MSNHEHSINRADSTRPSVDEDSEDEEGEGDEEALTDAEKRRELRKSALGRAILRQADRQTGVFDGR